MPVVIDIAKVKAPTGGWLDTSRQWAAGDWIPESWWRAWELKQAIFREDVARGAATVAPVPGRKPTPEARAANDLPGINPFSSLGLDIPGIEWGDPKTRAWLMLIAGVAVLVWAAKS